MKDLAVELIPRKTLFGNPERTAVTLSHDGTRVAYLAPVDGVLNVWVAPVEAIGDAKPVTGDRGRGIRHYLWSYHPGYLLYGQDRDGDEDWHVHAVEIDTGRTRDLTPYDGVQAIPHGLSDRLPDEVLIAINRRDPQYHDLYRVHILTGESGLVVENDLGASQILADHDFTPRLAVVIPPDGGAQILSRSGPGEWEPFMTIGPEDDVTTGPLHFDANLYLRDSRGRDTAALVALDTETGAVETLASDAKADAFQTISHPASHRPQAVAVEYQRVTWKVLDESVAADFERLADGDRGEFRPISRSLDDRTWIVSSTTAPTARRPSTGTIDSRAAWSTCSATARSSTRRSWRRWRPRSSGCGISSTSWLTTASLWARSRTARTARPNRCRRSSTSTAARGHGTVGATTPCTSS